MTSHIYYKKINNMGSFFNICGAESIVKMVKDEKANLVIEM